ncbi:MAG: hypothetical protein A3K19_08330 [Lentisphaerae bacterium RIFOXYB12_FULL_65_16]|nr:MAG: hypothetical protein A3K18_00330 [Lentisphaerae bacterium RIFOXYA12_64_32]OGV89876.1 MAG: hypothetical protein A3K19_08330 [Lentisphaerae bacterium RIFOXYB12_FULL_65_16]
MKTLSVHEAKTTLSAVLAVVERNHERFVICRHGKPIADLVPHRAQDRLTPHPVMRKIDIRYDPCESLSREEWPEEET